MSTGKKNFIGFFVIILFFATVVIGVQSFIDSNPQSDKNFYEDYRIYSLDIPDSIEFAGERVPLEYFDVREALDRELLVNTYWQSQTLLFIKRANREFELIEPILKRYGVPDDFKYLSVAESGLQNVVSPAQAIGYWQLLEGTAKDYGLEVNDLVDERYNVEKSTEAACKFLLDSYNKYGSWTMAAASYNMGRNNLDKQINRQKSVYYYDLLLGDETGRYIFRILSYKEILENPEKYGFFVPKQDLYKPISYKTVKVDTSVTDFADFAFRYNTNYKILKFFNPWLRDNYLINKNGKTYEIKIPRHGAREKNSQH